MFPSDCHTVRQDFFFLYNNKFRMLIFEDRSCLVQWKVILFLPTSWTHNIILELKKELWIIIFGIKYHENEISVWRKRMLKFFFHFIYLRWTLLRENVNIYSNSSQRWSLWFIVRFKFLKSFSLDQVLARSIFLYRMS